MKIDELISVFERLLPIYEKAYKSKYPPQKMDKLGIDLGLCFAALRIMNVDIYQTMDEYYSNCMKSTSLFPYPKDYKGLKTRIDFMKSEIKSLKRLQKRGYTHV